MLIFSALAVADELKTKLPQSNHPVQRFVCNIGYKVRECGQQLALLRSALAPYHPDRLGKWTWILVRSEDWKPILQRLGGDPDSPAFSVLEKRETFFEEALFVLTAARSAELLRVWSIPLDQLLNVAVTHELGHDICMDVSEARADKFGRLLREGRNPECEIAPRREWIRSH